MIGKQTALDALRHFHTAQISSMIDGDALKLRLGDYEYIFTADAVNYVGDGAGYVVVSLGDAQWTAHGNPTLEGCTLTLDGASWLSRGAVELGGKDFQIIGRVVESADDMIVRRKIFELYTSAALNISLYSSGAGKNLDLLTNVGGAFDDYTEPAILEREYNFALKWIQSTAILSLAIDGEEIYSRTVTGFNERRTFEQVLVGGSVLHDGATWKGTIADFKIYDGFAG